MPRHPASSEFHAAAGLAGAGRGRRAARVTASALLVLLLTGCTVPAPEPSGTSGTAAPTPSGTTPAETAPPPALVPDGTAADNLPLFAATTAAVWASEQAFSGRAYIDALTAAGFDKSAMQVTNDLSTVGNQAESIQFSVLWGDECLVGQIGTATGEPVAVVVPVLAEGMCLVGRTRPIDW